MGGILPKLLGRKRYNEDGVGGMHVYTPWWLDNRKLDFPRGYHIEFGGGMGMPGFPGGGFPGFPGMGGMPGLGLSGTQATAPSTRMKTLTSAEKNARKNQRKQSRDARKKNRKK